MPDGIGEWLWSLLVEARSDPFIDLLANVVVGLAGLAVGVMVLCLIVVARMGGKRRKGDTAKAEEPPNHTGTSRFERLLQWLVPPSDPWVVGDITVDFTWLAHCLVWGTTGSGKSTFVAKRIMRPPLGLWGLVVRLLWLFTGGTWPRRDRRGCLVFAGNMSKPFRAAVLWLMEHGYPCLIWEPDPTPGEGFGLDVLEGPPDNVAQRLIKMQPAANGDTGLRSGAVEGMLVDTVYTIDRANLPRNFGNILKYIRHAKVRDLDEAGNPVGEPRPMTTQEKAGLENWCTRFATLRRRLGACIGNDVKLSEVLAQGYVVFVQGSSYNNPNAINELTNLFVYYVMWLVGTVGNFDFIVDEPGAVEKGTFTRLLTATRAQGVRIMVCPQSLEQIDKTLREMCTTVLLLGTAAGAHEAQKLQSDMVAGDIDPVDFTLLKPTNWRERVAFWATRRGLRACSGYLLDNGRLDFVKTKPAGCKHDATNHKRRRPKHQRGCGLAILDRWPKGSIPKLPPPPDVLKDIAIEQSPPVVTGGESGSTVEGEEAAQKSAQAAPVDWAVIQAVPETLAAAAAESIPSYIAVGDMKERHAREQVWGHLLPLGVGRDGERVEGKNVERKITPCRVARDGLRASDGRALYSYHGSKELGYVMIYAWANNVDWKALKAMLADKRTAPAMKPSVHHTCHNRTCHAADHLVLTHVRRNSELEGEWHDDTITGGSAGERPRQLHTVRRNTRGQAGVAPVSATSRDD